LYSKSSRRQVTYKDDIAVDHDHDIVIGGSKDSEPHYYELIGKPSDLAGELF